RALAVDVGVAAGMPKRAQPARLPLNIYGTSGDWEIYSTPSRDARLKTAFKSLRSYISTKRSASSRRDLTAFKSLRDEAERFVEMYERGGDPHLTYVGKDMVSDMIA